MTARYDAETLASMVDLSKVGTAITHPAGGVAIVVPDGYELKHLRPDYTNPHHVMATPELNDVASFVHYVNKFKPKEGGAQIFADPAKDRLTAALDYHLPATPQPVDHKATLQLKLSPEWMAWNAINGQLIPQVAFAEFLEEHLLDVTAPPAASLLDMVTTFQSITNVEFASKVDISKGRQMLTFNETGATSSGKDKAEVPQKLELGLAVYEGEPRDAVSAFLRTRVKDGKLSFLVKLDRSAEIKRAAFGQLLEKIGAETGITVLTGSLVGDSRRY